MINRDRFPLLHALPVLASMLLIFCCFPARAQNRDGSNLPGVIHETEGRWSGTWTLNNGQYTAQWNNGAKAVLTAASFTSQSVILNRTDTLDSGSRGLTAVYTGQIASTGDRIINGHVTWTWPGVPGYPASGTWNASWVSATASIKILLDGRDVTGTAPSVVAGQQVNLRMMLSDSTACTLPMWSVQGTTVAGFEALPSFKNPLAGSALPTDFTKSSTTERFYWTQGGAFLVTAACGLGAGRLSAQIAFNVDMPDIPFVRAGLGDINIGRYPFGLAGTWLKLGGTLTSVGAEFKAEPATKGVYQWVQVLNTIKITKTAPKSKPNVLTKTHALDTYYPLNSNDDLSTTYEVTDNPGALLNSPYTYVSETMSATTFLMWNPRLPTNCILPSTEAGAGTCTSISVPLGYINWQWAGAARLNSRREWEAVPRSYSKSIKPFVRSGVFPSWLQRYISGCYPNCGRD